MNDTRINGLDFLPSPEKWKRQAEETKQSAETRRLLPFEIQSLAPIFESHGQPLPDPAACVFIGSVREDGKIIAFQVIQPRLHAEPVWIEPGNEDQYLSLIHTTERYLEENAPGTTVFLNTPPGKIARLAQLAGMTMEPWVTFSKQIKSQVVESKPETTIEDSESESQSEPSEESIN